MIDQISQPNFLLKTLGAEFKQAKLDLKNIVVAGHSFGGITALGAACADQRVKAAVSLDPWFFPHHMELNASVLENFLLQRSAGGNDRSAA